MTNLEYIICEAEANGEISMNTRDEMLSVITEKKTKAEYRKQKFLKKHNYDPKTGTIEMDGTRMKFYHTKGSNKRSAMPDAAVVSFKSADYKKSEKYTKKDISSLNKEISRFQDYIKDWKTEMNKNTTSDKTKERLRKYISDAESNIKIIEDRIKDCKNYLRDTRNGIHMNTASFNMKNPNSHEFIANHERGHIEADKLDKKYKGRLKPVGLPNPTKLSKDERKKIMEAIRYNNFCEENPDKMDDDKLEKYEDMIDEIIDKYVDMDRLEKAKYITLKNKIRRLIFKYKSDASKRGDHDSLNAHGDDTEEYIADQYSINHSKGGKKTGKKTLDEIHKRYKKIPDKEIIKNSNAGEKLDPHIQKISDHLGIGEDIDGKIKDLRKARKEYNKLRNSSKKEIRRSNAAMKEIEKSDNHNVHSAINNSRKRYDALNNNTRAERDKLTAELELNSIKDDLDSAKFLKRLRDDDRKRILDKERNQAKNEINLRKKTMDRLSKDKDDDVLKKK